MEFDLDRSIEQLVKTPQVLDSLLYGISFEWVTQNEGEDTWSAYDILGHLIHGEETDWMVRTEIILNSDNKGKGKFQPFDREAQFDTQEAKSMGEMLHEFQNLRRTNIAKLRELKLSEEDLQKTGMHPDLGKVNLQQLIATWVAHDLSHLAQIARVLAKPLRDEVGPWKKYLRILKQ